MLGRILILGLCTVLVGCESVSAIRVIEYSGSTFGLSAEAGGCVVHRPKEPADPKVKIAMMYRGEKCVVQVTSE